MPKSVIAYDKELPEIPGRLPWTPPSSYLVKDTKSPTGWTENTSGRRPTRLLMVSKIRATVDTWRKQGYPGTSAVSRRLFEYWFDEDHEVDGFQAPFRYYFCQREAIETLVWLVEIAGERDVQRLIQRYATIFQQDLISQNIEFQTTMEGQRQIRRFVPELDSQGVQDLPPEDLRRFAFKMATGSGKTWVMAMAVVWSYFHKRRVPGSELSTNFLIVAPNVIVYQRLEKDFASNRIFNELPLVPPEWRGMFGLKVILRGEATEPDASGNLFLSNIHQLYESRDKEWTPQNAVDALLGRKPAKDATSGQRSMLERLKSLKELVVLNDEAHHVHEEELAWNKSLNAIHRALPKGLSLWLDFSATPKDQAGMYFPWTVCDYPLAQAVEDRIVKAPLIVTKEDDPDQPEEDPANVTKDNVTEKYGYWIQAAVHRWKDHWSVYKKLGKKPVLFIMAEKNLYADALGEYLWTTKEFGFKESEVLVIHTDAEGEVTKGDLDKAREAARDIDRPNNKTKAIVSVMMLREGWDVKNVTVVLGLRPFTAKAEILPEQVIGRGLRLMPQLGPDRTQTLEVLGTRNLLNVLRTQLEAEGVGFTTTKTDPPKPVIIEPVQGRIAYDIAIPITKPSLVHDIRKLADLDVAALAPVFEQEELEEVYRIKLKLEFATVETEVHMAEIGAENLPTPQDLLGSIANKVIHFAKLPNRFAELYPSVRDYVSTRCFGREVDLDSETVRSHLMRPTIQEGIAKYLARKIAELTLDRLTIDFEKADFKLSATKAFSWRRNLPPLIAKHTVFNYVATYNNFERQFAEFLDAASDVLRFAALGTTEQGDSGTPFRVDYIKPSGAIGFYYPDWVAVQKTKTGPCTWIIETKGRVWEGTSAKDEAMCDWCARVSAVTGNDIRFILINQRDFNLAGAKTLESLIEAVEQGEPQQSLPGMAGNSAGWKMPSDDLYAFVLDIDKQNGNVYVNLDAAPVAYVRRIPLEATSDDPENNNRYRMLSEMPTYAIRMTLTAAQYAATLQQERPIIAERWYRVRLAKRGGYAVEVFNGVADSERGVVQATLSPIQHNESNLLRMALALPPPSPVNEIEAVLRSIKSDCPTSISVYNVGQGLCSAICDARNNMPLVYFDFGCGCYGDADTRPHKMSFCFKNNPPIILSHWHADHYMAACLLDDHALECKWVVPCQNGIPNTAKFAARLKQKGNLLVWPDTLAVLQTPYGDLLKCTGKTRNTSGLAWDAIIGVPESSQGPRYRVLMPGDAGYDNMGTAPIPDCHALIVAHHGGAASGRIPTPAPKTKQPTFVIPYGKSPKSGTNSYEHPDSEVVKALQVAGWKKQLNTPDGNISLGHNLQSICLAGGSCQSHCKMLIQQTWP